MFNFKILTELPTIALLAAGGGGVKETYKMVEYEEMFYFFKKTLTNTYSINLFRFSYSFVVMKKLEHATLLDVVWD